MVSARSIRAQNKKHYIKSIKELKAKAKNSNPDIKKAASRIYSSMQYGIDPEKRRLPQKLAIVLF